MVTKFSGSLRHSRELGKRLSEYPFRSFEELTPVTRETNRKADPGLQNYAARERSDDNALRRLRVISALPRNGSIRLMKSSFEALEGESPIDATCLMLKPGVI